MITFNAVYSQLSDNLPKNTFFTTPEIDSSIDNDTSFEDIINGIIDEETLINTKEIKTAGLCHAPHKGLRP